jgi:aquaporin Z
MTKQLGAEFIGTFTLVTAVCGAALFSAPVAGLVAVAFAVGLSVLAMAYAVGGISGGHFNPAVTLGLVLAGRAEAKELIPYWIAQLIGGVAGAGVLYLIASGVAGYSPGGFASNGFDANSPGGYGMVSALLIEVVLTAFFLLVILGSTSKAAPAGFAPLAIGLSLTLIHLISIPVTNTSVNPARSTATAIFAENGAITQLWLFWLAPLVGAAIGALIWKYVLAPGETPANVGQE